MKDYDQYYSFPQNKKSENITRLWHFPHSERRDASFVLHRAKTPSQSFFGVQINQMDMFVKVLSALHTHQKRKQT